jgi:ABC-type glycerol-3-phosphate transport system substrate-binding protein
MQQMNRRQLLKAMGASAGMLALAACAAPAPAAVPAAQSGESAAPAQEAVTVVLWSSFSGANGEAETALVNKFNEMKGGDIVVDYQFQGSYVETAQ